MYFYDPDPDILRELHQATDGSQTGGFGDHLRDVIGAFDPATKERFTDYMRVVVPELANAERRVEGSYVTVELHTRPRADGSSATDSPRSADCCAGANS